VSEDFGIAARRISRPADDQKRLNKDLFHLTYARLRHFEKPENKPWPHSILSCLHEPCIEFINHLLAHKGEFGTPGDFTKWERLIEALTSRRELRIACACTQAGVENCWSFSLGRQLQSGRSELTELHPKTKRQ
jgi:hypothetical protein